MAQQLLVTVQNIKNPGIKRQMTVASAKLNSRKWRIIEGAESQAQEVKKKAVSPVAESKATISIPLPHDKPESEFATIETEKETLQKEYEELSGKKPDGRFNETKLKEMIATLKTPA